MYGAVVWRYRKRAVENDFAIGVPSLHASQFREIHIRRDERGVHANGLCERLLGLVEALPREVDQSDVDVRFRPIGVGQLRIDVAGDCTVQHQALSLRHETGRYRSENSRRFVANQPNRVAEQSIGGRVAIVGLHDFG